MDFILNCRFHKKNETLSLQLMHEPASILLLGFPLYDKKYMVMLKKIKKPADY
jgi:hypothetical protein